METGVTKELIDDLKEMLIKNEGMELKPYQCTSDKTTIGVGLNLTDNGITIQEAEMLLGIEARQIMDEFKRAKEKGYKGSYKDFLNRTKADELDSRIRFFNSGGSVKPNGKAKDKPFTTAIERKYGILLSGNETLAEVLEMIKNKPQE